MRSRILLGLIAGTFGGLIGWFLQEMWINYNAREIAGGKLALCVGGCTGLFLGAVEGVLEGSQRKLLKGMLLGAFFGFLLGGIGLSAGNLIYNALGGGDALHGSVNILLFAQQVVARSLGWAFLGIGLGVGSALATGSKKRIRNGAIGGLIGGFLGGFVFDMIAMSANAVQLPNAVQGVHDIGGPSRMVGFTAIGGLTGFFIGLVDELTKQAWVKVLAGKNEGKEFILSRPMNIFGRDERSDVPLFGDMGVGLQHAAIRADGKRHMLIDANTPQGTVVNGQRVNPGAEHLLRDGDMLQIGQHRILFSEKATRNRYARPLDEPKSVSAVASTPMPPHLCPFCGAPKNTPGGCLCSAGLPAIGSVNPQTAASVSIPSAFDLPPIAAQNGYAAAFAIPALPGFTSANLVPRLTGLEGPYAGQVIPLNGANITVGREPDRNLVLVSDTTISRNHAWIGNDGNSIVVYDNQSSNGTFVNGMRITAQQIHPGDVVQFGSSKFRYDA